MAEIRRKEKKYRAVSYTLDITLWGFTSYEEAKKEQYNLNCAEEIIGALGVIYPWAEIKMPSQYYGGPLEVIIFNGEYKLLRELYKKGLRAYLEALGIQLEALDNTIKELNLNCLRAHELGEMSRPLERQYRLLKEALRNSLPGKEELQ